MTIETVEREDGKLIAVAGQSRWGKSHWVKKMIKPAPRLLVWDPRGEYISEGLKPIKTLPALAVALAENAKGKARLCYWGSLHDFEGFCDLAYHWGMLWPSVIVLEETADVTSPGKAPNYYGQLLRKGMYYGNHIYVTTQRPQESDKTAWGNASLLHVHGLVSPKDRRYMADYLGITEDELAALAKYEYYEKPAGETAKKYNAKGVPSVT